MLMYAHVVIPQEHVPHVPLWVPSAPVLVVAWITVSAVVKSRKHAVHVMHHVIVHSHVAHIDVYAHVMMACVERAR